MTRQAIAPLRILKLVALLIFSFITLIAIATSQNAPTRPVQKKQSAHLANSNTLSFQPVVTYNANGQFPLYSDWSLAVADINGDGKLDIVLTNFNGAGNEWDQTHGAFGVLLGNGDGTFQPIQSTLLSQSTSYLAIGDLNGDGKPDLVISGCCETNNDGLVTVLLGNGDGTFQSPVSYDSGGTAGGVGGQIALADLNKDGKLDVVVVNWGDSLGVLLGNGDGTLQSAQAYRVDYNAFGLGLADLNKDGKTDAAVVAIGDFGALDLDVLLGNGDGTFQPYASSLLDSCAMTSLAIADLNGDGAPDVVGSISGNEWCGPNGAVGVALGNGDGTFQPMVFYDAGGYYPNSVRIADVDEDGIKDILVANACGASLNCQNETEGTVGVLLGNGDGTFQPPVVFFSGGSSGDSIGSLAVADLNGDGRPDLVVANLVQNTVGVLLNTTGIQATTTTLVSKPNPSAQGRPVTFTATVSSPGGSPPNGETVTFYDGSGVLDTVPLNGGVASLTTSSLSVGKHAITASYAGDSAFGASTSAPLTQVVIKLTVPWPPHR